MVFGERFWAWLGGFEGSDDSVDSEPSLAASDCTTPDSAPTTASEGDDASTVETRAAQMPFSRNILSVRTSTLPTIPEVGSLDALGDQAPVLSAMGHEECEVNVR